MTKDEIISYQKTNNIDSKNGTEDDFSKNFSEDHNKIIEFNEKYYPNNNFIWQQKLYNYLHDIIEIPRCIYDYCENEVEFYLRAIYYHQFYT